MVGATALSSSKAISKTTEILHGEQNVVNTIQFTSKANNIIDACVDYTMPSSLVVKIQILGKAEHRMRLI